MSEKILCPLCKKEVYFPLWSLGLVSKEQLVALKLMEVEAVCNSCWEAHMEQLEPGAMLGVLTSLMDDYVCLVDEHAQLEKSTDKTIEELEEENKGLRESLEEVQGKIMDALR